MATGYLRLRRGQSAEKRALATVAVSYTVSTNKVITPVDKDYEPSEYETIALRRLINDHNYVMGK